MIVSSLCIFCDPVRANIGRRTKSKIPLRRCVTRRAYNKLIGGRLHLPVNITQITPHLIIIKAITHHKFILNFKADIFKLGNGLS